MKRLLLVMGLALLVVLLSSSVALAYHKGPTSDPHQKYGYDPITGSETDFCLQCHDIHAAAGDYALMAESTVVGTCGTCHGVYNAAPTGARDPGYPGEEAGPPVAPSSAIAVYKVPLVSKYSHNGHRMGLNLNGAGSWTYASGPGYESTTTGYTTDSPNFIPGSGFPGTSMTYDYVNRINSWLNYIANGDMSAFLASDKTALGGLYCASCHSPHGTVRGSALPGNRTKNKLLSSRPNHAVDEIDISTWPATDTFETGGWRFCSKCHEARLEPASGVGDPDGVAPHNHPSTFCLTCHGVNPSDPDDNNDFPHTSSNNNLNLLSDFPDALCVNGASCHFAGLP